MLTIFRRLSVLLLLVFAVPAVAAIKTVTVQSAAGPFAVYVDGPANAEHGLILVHDYFGVSPAYFDAIQHWANKGYRVVGVDLYNGKSAQNDGDANGLLIALNPDDAAKKVDAAVNWLNKRTHAIATMGFSMGTRYALGAALTNKAVMATVLWYPFPEPVTDPAVLKNLSGPVLYVIGSKDGFASADGIAADGVAKFSLAMDDAGVGAEMYMYPGVGHAFAQRLFWGGANVNADATNAAYHVTNNFLKRRFHKEENE